jgi:UDP-2,4-diacetamido-2,4,6-trideoxy-beta-L-altropyranose hydrolase
MHTLNRKSSNRRIIFRADGNSQIGLGHVIRSLALADMLREEYTCVFAIREPSESLVKEVSQVCDELIHLPFPENDLQEATYFFQNFIGPRDIVVLDGYKFATDYQRVIKSNNNPLICIDDIYAYHFVADVVINHAGGITASHYSVEPYTQLCLGPKYVLLRRPFLMNSHYERNIKQLDKVLICMGGADPNNYTYHALKSCLEVDKFSKIEVVIGSAYPFKETLQSLIEKTSSAWKVNILTNISGGDLACLMSNCGIALCAASTIAFEYCSLNGLLVLYLTADNQKNIYHYFLNAGLAIDSDSFIKEMNNINSLKDYFNTSVHNQRAVFDGKSAERLKKVIALISDEN